jgi:hypothetical protein
VVEQDKAWRTAHLLGQTLPSRLATLVVTAGRPTGTTFRATGDARAALVGGRLPTTRGGERAEPPIAAVLGGRGVTGGAAPFLAARATAAIDAAVGGTALTATADLPQRAAGAGTADPPEGAAELGLRLRCQLGDRGGPTEPEQAFQEGAAVATGGKRLGQRIETTIVHGGSLPAAALSTLEGRAASEGNVFDDLALSIAWAPRHVKRREDDLDSSRPARLRPSQCHPERSRGTSRSRSVCSLLHPKRPSHPERSREPALSAAEGDLSVSTRSPGSTVDNHLLLARMDARPVAGSWPASCC